MTAGTMPHIIEEGKDFLRLLSPAKINLFLYVTGKRPDGYHELLSLMCPVSLYDNLTLYFDRPEITVACPHPEVPEDRSNLAWRAAELFFQQSGISRGLDIRIEKNIPVAGGLGGGSSNAATVLLALNRHYGQPFSLPHLAETAMTLGADVPFFIYGRPALARGIGEKLEFTENLPNFSVLLISFDCKVSTAYVYKNLNLGLTKGQKIINDVPFKEYSIDVLRYLYNDLERVTVADYPVINEVKKTLREHGAVGALMSGSGPTVFGLFTDAEKAREVCGILSDKYNDRRLYPVDMLL